MYTNCIYVVKVFSYGCKKLSSNTVVHSGKAIVKDIIFEKTIGFRNW